MQPFLTRTPRLSRTSACLPSVVRSPAVSVLRTPPTPSPAQHVANTVAHNSMLSKYGEFYRRFYSAFAQGTGADIRGRHEGNRGAQRHQSETEEEWPPPQPDYGESLLDIPAKPADVTGTSRGSQSLPLEDCAVSMIRQLNDHSQLVLDLEKEIHRVNGLFRRREISEEEQAAHYETLSGLKAIYMRVSMRYYDVTEARKLIQSQLQGLNQTPRARRDYVYVPPYPCYDTSEPPISLNKTLLNIFATRRHLLPHWKLVPSVTTAILKSRSPPDAKTFNILIHGFTIHRLNSLAQITFRSMLSSGIPPDDYTITSILNLCIKSADFPAYAHTVRTFHAANSVIGSGSKIPSTPSKRVLEAMIHGAAKFGKWRRIYAYVADIRRHHRIDATLSLPCLTALLKLCAQKRDWVRGRQLWSQIVRYRMQELDRRALRQMLHLCSVCDKRYMIIRLMGLAERKGWEWSVFVGIHKHKGLRVRRTVKLPPLVKALQEGKSFGSYVARKMKRVKIEQRRQLMEAVEDAFQMCDERQSRWVRERAEMKEKERLENLEEEKKEKEGSLQTGVFDWLVEDVAQRVHGPEPEMVTPMSATDTGDVDAERVSHTVEITDPLSTKSSASGSLQTPQSPDTSEFDSSTTESVTASTEITTTTTTSSTEITAEERSDIWHEILRRRIPLLEEGMSGAWGEYHPPPSKPGDPPREWKPSVDAYSRGFE